jgi:outer membrane protein assembly factor BamB
MSPPHFVLVDDGRRIAVDYGSFVAVHEDGAVFTRGNGMSRTWSALRSDGLLHGDALVAYDGKTPERALVSGGLSGLVDEPGLQIATLVDTRRWLSLVRVNPPRGERVLWIASACDPSEASTLDWRAKQHGFATGAIADGGRVLVATRDGGLTLYAGEGTGKGHAPRVLAIRELDREFYAVSVMSDGFAVLESHDEPGATPDDRGWRIYESSGSAAARGWQTELHRLDPEAATRWTVRVPLAVTQPAIDGGDRIWLAGNGLAVVADGRVLWSRTSDQRHRATAFREGTLAVAHGDTLELVGRRGTPTQVLRVPGGHVITTPPAISGDGRLWVATDDGRVWVAS